MAISSSAWFHLALWADCCCVDIFRLEMRVAILLLFQIVQSKAFTFLLFNACPSIFLTLKYGPTAAVNDDLISSLQTGYSSLIEVSYSPVYYQFQDWNGNIFVTSMLNITNENQNGIGYVLYPTGGCQNFQYAPADPSLSSRSVVVYVNGGQMDKSASVGSDDYQGRVYAKPDSYLEITSNSTIVYTTTYVRFCNDTCADSSRGGATIPIGSAIFFINYCYSATDTYSTVAVGATGSTTYYQCPYYAYEDCIYPGGGGGSDSDDSLSSGTVAGIVCGIIGGSLLLLGVVKLIHLTNKKKDSVPLIE